MSSERERILVGIDDSDASRAALRWAIDEALRRHADLELVSCWHRPYIGAASAYVDYLPSDEMNAGALAELQAATDELHDELDALAASGCDVTTRLLEGDPGARLVTESKGVSLIVVGRARGPVARTILGSVSRHVTARAHCPTVVVPPEDHDLPAHDVKEMHR
jgi:nucleotide-binding universal stress UspA family protein